MVVWGVRVPKRRRDWIKGECLDARKAIDVNLSQIIIFEAEPRTFCSTSGDEKLIVCWIFI